MNWLLIVVCVILFFCTIDGYRKGFVHVLISLLSIVLTIILVGVVNPYISDFLINKTPLYNSINERVITMLEQQEKKEGQPNTEDPTEIPDENTQESQYGTDESVDAGTGEIGLSDGNGNEISAKYQSDAIKGFAFPAIIKKALMKNNNETQYALLEAVNFNDYIAKYVTQIIIKVISFFITFLIITFILRMTFFTLDFVANLPLIRGVNKLAGLGIGLIQGVLIIWIAFFAVVFFAGNDISEMLYAQINANPFLKVLFDYNMVLNYVLNKSFLV